MKASKPKILTFDDLIGLFFANFVVVVFLVVADKRKKVEME